MSDGHTHSTIGGNIDAMTLGVDGMMMLRAQQDGVVQRCNSALSPVNDVMRFGPTGRSIAMWEHASAVPHNEGSSDVGRNGPHRATNIERQTRRINDDSVHFAVTCEALGSMSRYQR